MANSVFSLDKFTDAQTKLNMDELFEKKRVREQKQIELFQKILNRVHARIKQCSRGFKPQTFCWFSLPTMIIGTANYDANACIAYIMHSLQENDFQVKYYTPYTLLINWGHWVPSYIRAKIKQSTGVEVDKFGHTILEPIDEEEYMDEDPRPPNKYIAQQAATRSRSSPPAPTLSKPPKTNNLIYSTEMLDTKLDFRNT